MEIIRVGEIMATFKEVTHCYERQVQISGALGVDVFILARDTAAGPRSLERSG